MADSGISAQIRQRLQEPQRTIRRPVAVDTALYRLHLQAEATLQTASARVAVKLPAYVDRLEWIASQVLTIYDELQMMCSVLRGYCNDNTCSRMCDGQCEYRWSDHSSAPEGVSAAEYRTRLVKWAFGMLSDQSLLPVDGSPFPDPGKFEEFVQTFLRRTFRVYAHTYVYHFEDVTDGGIEAHVNFCYKHFLFFVTEFNLLEDRDMYALCDLNAKFLGTSPDAQGQTQRTPAEAGA